jgi:putative aminopeptidase FrvX
MRNPMAIPAILDALLRAPGPSGNEEAAARLWRDAAAGFAEVTSDTLGTSFARVHASNGAAAPALAIVGHIDEIGVAITNVEESGLLSFTNIGGITPEALVGTRVDLLTRGGIVPGVIARRRLTHEQQRDRPRLEQHDLHIDIGARDRAEAESLVRPGDAGVWRRDPLELPNGRLVSKSLDNRLGAYVALEAARRLAEPPRAEVDVVAVAATLEELGSFGARPAAFALDPLVALVVDVTYTTDVPGGEERRAGKVELDGGAMIGVGPTLSKPVSDLLADVADEEGIPHGLEVSSRLTMTDADEIYLSRAGIPTGLLSIPLRYLHTPTEMCSLADVESVVRLVVAFARRLRREQSFVR